MRTAPSNRVALAITRALQNSAVRASPAIFGTASSTIWTRSMARNNRPNQPLKKPTEYSRPPGATPESKPDSVTSAPTNPNQGAQSSDQPDFSKAQQEMDINPTEARAPTQPLPDLTKGIPSTLEYETTGNSKLSPLDVTEADEFGQPSAGGRGKGELPASAYVSSSDKKRARAANIMYATFVVFMMTGVVYLGRNWDDAEEERQHPEAPSGWAVGLMWNRARARLGDQLNYYQKPAFTKLLPDPDPLFERPYTLVLSLEDLLIHSEWSREHGWRMAKRPGLDYFLRYLSQYYELVIFTSQPWSIADPVVRKLDPYHIVTWPLFREATLYENGEYVKDLSFLNRDLSKVILLDTVKSHAKNQPENAIILPKWKGDPKDKELVSFIPFLEFIHTMAYSDVRKAIASFDGTHIPTEFAKREAVARKKFHEQLAEDQKKRPKRSGLGALQSALGIKGGGMMVMQDGEQTPAEAFAQGKMLQDQARERGLRNYEALEKEIRENGEKWLKEEAANEEKAREEGMKAMKSGFTGWFGGGGGGGSGSPAA